MDCDLFNTLTARSQLQNLPSNANSITVNKIVLVDL